MSTPTIGSNKETVISPEFKAYLSYLRNHRKKHLYVNLQDNRYLNMRNAKSAADVFRSYGDKL